MASIRRNAPIVKPLPPRELLLSRLDYNAETGALVWKRRPETDFRDFLQFRAWNGHHAGKPAGYKQKRYQYIGIGETQYLAHRIVWVMQNGPIPDGMLIDHKNGNGHDNRIDNLRLATGRENQQNQTPSARSSSGVLGVYWNKARCMYLASYTLNGKRVHLGCFSDLAKAARAARAARRSLGYSDRHLGIG